MKTLTLIPIGLLLSIQALASAAPITQSQVELIKPQNAKAESAATVESGSTADSGGLRMINFQISPIGMVKNRKNFSLELGMNDRVTFGPKFSILENGFEAGFRSSTYLWDDRFNTSPIIRVGAFRGEWTNTDLNEAKTEKTLTTVKGAVFEVLGAYQLVLPFGLNVDLGAGLNFYQQASATVTTSTGVITQQSQEHWVLSPIAELNVGIAL